jgi:hypothetical protein
MGYELLIKIIVAIIFAVIVFFAKKIWWALSGLFNKLFNDLPDLSGTWQAEYQELDKAGLPVTTKETIELKQLGRLIWGGIKNHTDDQDEFKFSGHIIGCTIIANHWGKLSRKAVGSCAFMLRVHSNGDSMLGQCTWHDYHSDKIECSQYTWRRK